jgi:hypothetical protein
MILSQYTLAQIKHLVLSLIWHGRFFSKSRDEIVIKKSVEYIIELIKKENKDD